MIVEMVELVHHLVHKEHMLIIDGVYYQIIYMMECLTITGVILYHLTIVVTLVTQLAIMVDGISMVISGLNLWTFVRLINT